MKSLIDNLEDSRSSVPKSQCPQCLKNLDMIRSIGGKRQPKQGDYTLCLYCETVLEFDNDLHLIYASDKTLKKIAGTETFKNNNHVGSILADRMRKRN